jgi:hypothetical protein
MWWMAMRIISVPTVSAMVDESQVLLLNPWEPHAMQRGLMDPLLDEHARPARPAPNPPLPHH